MLIVVIKASSILNVVMLSIVMLSERHNTFGFDMQGGLMSFC